MPPEGRDGGAGQPDERHEVAGALFRVQRIREEASLADTRPSERPLVGLGLRVVSSRRTGLLFH